MDVVGGVLMVGGACMVALAGLGVVRFGSFGERIHPATKSSTLGMLLLTAGAALQLSTWGTAAKLLVIAVSFLVTAPVAGHLLGRAVQASGQLDDEPDTSGRPREQ